MFEEPLVVGPWHGDVGIIVPRDEPSVTHGTQHTSIGKIVRDAMFATHLIHSQQYRQDMLLHLFYLIICHFFAVIYPQKYKEKTG
jgi:hypothetical protein